jgi:hypothetical protein
MPCPPMRRQMTWGSPGRTSWPYMKVARPSGAQVRLQTPGCVSTRWTRRPGRGWRPALGSSTKRSLARMNASAWLSARYSAMKRSNQSKVGTSGARHPQRRVKLLFAVVTGLTARRCLGLDGVLALLPQKRPVVSLIRCIGPDRLVELLPVAGDGRGQFLALVGAGQIAGGEIQGKQVERPDAGPNGLERGPAMLVGARERLHPQGYGLAHLLDGKDEDIGCGEHGDDFSAFLGDRVSLPHSSIGAWRAIG